MFELVYTAAPRGLLAGRSGFSTVAITAGFPPNLISPVENMSGYRNLFPPGHPDAERNPVNYSCRHYRWGGTLFIVLSKISCAGLSYTGRTNVLAHHLLFTPAELAAIPGGATAVLRCPENFPPWSGDPRELPRKSLKHVGRAPGASPGLWAELAGDEKWAACIADHFRTDPENGWICAFDPAQISGETLLDLIDSAAHCLSPEEAMNFTFSTYCPPAPGGNSFFLRACPEDPLRPADQERPASEHFLRLGRHTPLPEGWQPPAPPEPPKPADPPVEPVRLTVIEPPERPEAPEQPSPPAPVRLSFPPRPPRVRALAPQGTRLPPAPPQKDTQVPEPPPEKRLSLRGIIFAAAVLFLGGVLLFCLFGPAPGKKEIRRPAPPPVKKVPRGVPPRKAAPGRSAHSPAAGSGTPRKKTEPKGTVQLPAAKPTPPPVSPEERLGQRFLFHREFNLGRKAPLPAAFRNASALTVKLNGIGTEKKIDDLDRYVSGSGRKINVHPFKVTRYELSDIPSRDDRSQHVMTLELKDGFLVVEVPEPAGNRPRIENIGMITVTCPDGSSFEFTPGVPDRDFIGIIRRNPGTLTVRRAREGEAAYDCSFKMSDDLRAFWRHLVLRINGRIISGDADSRPIEVSGPDFTGAQALIDQWNKAVSKYRKACGELGLRSQEVKKFKQDLKNLLARVPDGRQTQKADLQKAIEKRKPSISPEIAALCAKLPPPPDKKKEKSVSPVEPPLKQQFEELGKRWDRLQERKAKLRRQYDIYKERQAGTLRQLQALPGELFAECRKEVERGKCVPSGFYERFSPEQLKNAVTIETEWREDHGSASNDR